MMTRIKLSEKMTKIIKQKCLGTKVCVKICC